MKILYGIQGTGNGHIIRSREIISRLKGLGAEVEVLLSDSHSEIDAGSPVKFRPRGLGFVFGKKGGIDLMASIKSARPHVFFSTVRKLPVEEYDIVVSDFEPVTSWACLLKGLKCVSLSHQTAFVSEKCPRPAKVDRMSEALMKWYAPVSIPLGLHFEKYDSFIETPLIRSEVRQRDGKNLGHYTVYLPSFAPEEITPYLKNVDVEWHLFSKHTDSGERRDKNVLILPVDREKFADSICSGEGVFCNSGFETPSEALFLGKKLFAIPMAGQYEQKCNAAALKRMGAKVEKKVTFKLPEQLESFVNMPKPGRVEFDDNSLKIAEKIIGIAEGSEEPETVPSVLRNVL